MIYRISSIKRLLLVCLIVPLVSMRVISGYLAVQRTTAALEKAHDRTLEDVLQSITTLLSLGNIAENITRSQQVIQTISGGRADQMFFQISTEEGEMLVQTKQIPRPARFDGAAGLQTVLIEDEKFRLASSVVQERTEDGRPGRKLLVQIVQSTIIRDQDVGETVSATIWWSAIFIALVCTVVFWGVRTGMKPLELLQRRIRERRAGDFSPLKADDVPEEVLPLVNAINSLLKRLSDEVSTQQRFIDNAAHQLKTPLAGLRNLAEISLRRSRDEATSELMQKMMACVDRTTNLSRKLLSFSRASFATNAKPRPVRAELVGVARKVIVDCLPEAEARSTTLELDADSECLWIAADNVEMYELLSNLVENAIRYSHDGSRVVVSIKAEGDIIHISVLDSGPGIPAEEQELIFERFYRVLGNQADGSGLGLAIVKEIVGHYGAELALSTGLGGRGLGVHIRAKGLLVAA
jgi:two-component system sensor histidine kinase TctE